MAAGSELHEPRVDHLGISAPHLRRGLVVAAERGAEHVAAVVRFDLRDVPAPAVLHRLGRRVRLERAAVRDVRRDCAIGKQAAGKAVIGRPQLLLEQERSEPRAVDVEIVSKLLTLRGDQRGDAIAGLVQARFDDLAVEVMHADLLCAAVEVVDESPIVEVIGVG